MQQQKSFVYCGRLNKVATDKGFSLVEFIAVLVIVSIIAAVVYSRYAPHATLQLQGGRDQVISALFSAQQKAMSQLAPVQLSISNNTVDLRVDANRDGIFSANESVRVGGVQYPMTLQSGLMLTPRTLVFNRLGHTQPSTIYVMKGNQQVMITVSATGYAY